MFNAFESDAWAHCACDVLRRARASVRQAISNFHPLIFARTIDFVQRPPSVRPSPPVCLSSELFLSLSTTGCRQESKLREQSFMDFLRNRIFASLFHGKFQFDPDLVSNPCR